LARELTKLHEEVRRGSLAQLVAALGDDDPRGECVLLVGATAADTEAPDAEVVDAAIVECLARGASTRDAAAEVSTRFGIARRGVYERALTLSRGR